MLWCSAVVVLFMLSWDTSYAEVDEDNINSTVLQYKVSSDLNATGCITNSTLELKFHDNSSYSFIGEENTFIDCRKLIKTNAENEFLIFTNTTENFCDEYKFSSDEYDYAVFIQGDNFKIDVECPKQTKINVLYDCPLKNFSVAPELIYMSKQMVNDPYISLKMPWEQLKLERFKIRVQSQNDSSPYCRRSVFSLDSCDLVRNDSGSGYPTCTFETECSYNIFITATHAYCAYHYTVPGCVDETCNCKKYSQNAEILYIEPIGKNRYLIEWDPGRDKVNNNEQKIIDLKFTFLELNTLNRADVQSSKHDFDSNRSEVEMILAEEKEYNITGSFENNFYCYSHASVTFKVPYQYNTFDTKTLIIIGMASVFFLVCCLALSFQYCKRLLKKIVDIVVPNDNQESADLIPLRSVPVPVTTNTFYAPSSVQISDDFEFPRDQIVIKEEIGGGAFGTVYYAKAIGIGGIQGYKMVAVKTIGDNQRMSREALIDYMAEIEIFKRVGKHPNIIRLLGCCTLEEPYWMIMEFAPCGDLKNYLLDLRKQWTRQNKARVFFPENSDGVYIHPPSQTTLQTYQQPPLRSASLNSFIDDPLTPRLADFSLELLLDHTELQNFAFQIAKGMAHLEKIPITHRDLAARNILINEYKTLKISDFGLSRAGPYINTKTKKLPLRWTAIESIMEQKYDSKSDVWSFGVVLWEIGTLGAFPYENVHDSFLLQFLQIGRRLNRPEICTDELYSLMCQCWMSGPEERPTFEELVEALDVKKRKVYVNFDQLNPTYVFPPSELQTLPTASNNVNNAVNINSK